MTCPLDDQACDSGQLVLNRAIMGQLADLQIHCCHGLQAVESEKGVFEVDPEGCPELIRIGEREQHEGTCMFAWVECPVGRSLCGPIRRRKLEEHMEACTMIPCPFADFGERGRCSGVWPHSHACVYMHCRLPFCWRAFGCQ